MAEICTKDAHVALPATATRGLSLVNYLAQGARLVEDVCTRDDECRDGDNTYPSSASDTSVDEGNAEPPNSVRGNVLRNRKMNVK